MAKRPQTFRHNDAARLIRAATAAGLTVRSVSLERGVVKLQTDGASPSEAPNPWDQIPVNNPPNKDQADRATHQKRAS